MLFRLCGLRFVVGGVGTSCCGLVALWFSCVVGDGVGLVYLVFGRLFTSLDLTITFVIVVFAVVCCLDW